MKRTILMTSLLTIMTCGFSQSSSPDEAAIRSIVQSMEDGWNSRDGKKFASGFYKQHNYIVVNGLYFSNITPEMNAGMHQEIFNTVYRTTDLELKVDKINFVRPDLAMTYAFAATYEKGSAVPENPGAIISMVIEKKDGEWKIISFHNCPIQASFVPSEQQAPVPMKVMFGNWYR